MNNDPFAGFKATQREGWALFAPLETITTLPAAQLVEFAGVAAGERVLDVACGTGVVAVTAARRGARVSGLDLSPALLERAGLNAATADVAIEFTEGDVEALPYPDGAFDVVLSQFGHMFAPRPAIAIGEMLRVLRPGGRIAFTTWPPEMFTGRMFALVSHYLPPPVGVPPSIDWGNDRIVRERLGDAVAEVVFERDLQDTPTLSPAHYRLTVEATAAPVIKLVAELAGDPARLAAFRRDFEQLVALFLRQNAVRQHYLMTRAVKR